jgi:hypothetical protein
MLEKVSLFIELLENISSDHLMNSCSFSYRLNDIVGHEAQLVCIVHGEANPEVNN